MTTKQTQTFEDWMAEVESAFGFLTLGLSTADVADFDFYSAFEDERSPMSTAKKVLRGEGYGR